jgi:hypothetical protein
MKYTMYSRKNRFRRQRDAEPERYFYKYVRADAFSPEIIPYLP